MPGLGQRIGFTGYRIWRKRRTERYPGVKLASRKIDNVTKERWRNSPRLDLHSIGWNTSCCKKSTAGDTKLSQELYPACSSQRLFCNSNEMICVKTAWMSALLLLQLYEKFFFVHQRKKVFSPWKDKPDFIVIWCIHNLKLIWRQINWLLYGYWPANLEIWKERCVKR